MSDVGVFFKIGLITQGQTAEVWLEEGEVGSLFKTYQRVKNSMGSRYEEKTPFVTSDRYGRNMAIDLQQVSLIMVLE